MKWYRRLFWKTFGIIWVTGFCILMLTVWLVGEMSERQHFQQSMRQQVQVYARLMIEKYQRRGFKPFVLVQHKPPKGWVLDFDPMQSDTHNQHIKKRIWHTMLRRVRIVDLKRKQPIFRRATAIHWHKKYRQQFKIYVHDRFYRVEVNLKPPFAPSPKVLNWFFSLQMLIIALLSMFAALFVSLMITRPLYKLRLQVRSIYQQEAMADNKKLLKRGDEIGELARDFKRMTAYIEQTNEGQRRLLQDVSHELRSPLARLQAAVGLLEQRLGLDNANLQRILQECQNLDVLIAQLLGFAHLQQTSVHIVQAMIPLVHKQIENMQVQQPERHFEVQLSATDLQVNPYLLERALGNILQNACQYSPIEQPIEVRLWENEQETCLLVRDYGQGVTEEALALLCQPFFRQQTKGSGFGLGLSIAHQAVERMGASLDFKNMSPHGLQVSIHFKKVLDDVI